MKNEKRDVKVWNRVLIIISLIMVVFIFLIAWVEIDHYNKVASINFPVYDEVLSPKVNDYLQRNAVGVLKSVQGSVYDGVSKSNFSDQVGNYCASWIHGYDDQYIYAYATCDEYGWFYHYNSEPGDSETIKISRSLQRGTGWSSYVRLSYKPGTDFEITGYREPRGGATYHKDVEDLFANIFDLGYPGSPTTQTLETTMEELKARFRQEHGDDPFPNHIDEIYAIKNPKIVVVGEVE